MERKGRKTFNWLKAWETTCLMAGSFLAARGSFPGLLTFARVSQKYAASFIAQSFKKVRLR